MSKDSGPPLDKWFVGVVNDVNLAMEDAAEQVSDEGQKLVYEFMETRPTSREWTGNYGNPARKTNRKGRVDTGNMRAAVEQDAQRRSKSIVFARFGWLNHYEEYFGMQEEGFVHPFAGNQVEAMNAMGDAEDIMVKRASEIIGSELRRV